MSRRSGLRRPKAACFLALALMEGAAMARPAWAASPMDLYYERAVMSAADARCGLFSPDLASALAAAAAQARGAALRAGATSGEAEAVRLHAGVAAASAACNSPGVITAAGRVRTAFQGYSRFMRLDLPGDLSGWTAERRAPAGSAGWLLSQRSSLSGAPLVFGLAGRKGEPPQLVAVTDFGQGPQPYAARLVLRDPSRAPEPYLGVLRVSATAAIPLSSRTPPRFAARVVSAEARGPADRWLLPEGSRSATLFRFPAGAVEQVAALDPREAITVEFLYAGRSGDVARQAYVEVGDFAAGRAFITLSR